MMRMVYVGLNPVLRGKTALVHAQDSTVVEKDDSIERVTADLNTLSVDATVMAQFDDFKDMAVKPFAFDWHPFTRSDFAVPPCTPKDHHWLTEYTNNGERCQCGAVSFPPQV